MAKAKSNKTEDQATNEQTTSDDTKAEVKTVKDSRKDDKTVALEKAENAETGDDGMPKHDEKDLAALKGDKRQVIDVGRVADVEVNPPEAAKNHADWLEGREPNDVVEVSGQRETAEARMARNGQASPEKAAGATTLSKG